MQALGVTQEVRDPDIITAFLFTYYNWIIFAIAMFIIIWGVKRYIDTRRKKDGQQT